MPSAPFWSSWPDIVAVYRPSLSFVFPKPTYMHLDFCKTDFCLLSGEYPTSFYIALMQEVDFRVVQKYARPKRRSGFRFKWSFWVFECAHIFPQIFWLPSNQQNLPKMLRPYIALIEANAPGTLVTQLGKNIHVALKFNFKCIVGQ